MTTIISSPETSSPTISQKIDRQSNPLFSTKNNRSTGFSLLRNRSLTTRLLTYVLGGSFIGLGGASLLFYGVLQSEAEDKIQSALEAQVERINGEINETAHGVENLIAAVLTLRNGGVQDGEIYKDLIFSVFPKST